VPTSADSALRGEGWPDFSVAGRANIIHGSVVLLRVEEYAY
jgi:hypothetical protein